MTHTESEETVTAVQPLGDVLLEPVAKQKSNRRNRKCGKVNTKKTLICYGNNLQGEASKGVYLQTDDERDEDTMELDIVYTDDKLLEDDLCYSNWKKGCQFCRSVSKRAKPKIKRHRRVKVVDKKKSSKTAQNISENSDAQKANAQEKLDNLKIKRFGYEIYGRRCNPEPETVSKTHSRRKSHKRSYTRREPQNLVDHPNALKHELKHDNAAKGANHMNQIADIQHRDITPEDYELLLMLDDSVAPKTVSTDFLTSLPLVSVEEANLLEELCAICMEAYQTSEKAKQLPCNHLFHVNCIDNWLSNASPNCPLDGVSVQC